MNPIILYDNRFEDGALSATDTESGFDVNNIKDLRPHTFWKAASYGTKYITRAPFAKDTLAQEEMRISPADGYAGVYLPASLDLTPYLGDRIVCLDSALKKHIGYLKSVGNKAVNYSGAASNGSGTMQAIGTGNFTISARRAFPANGVNRYIFTPYSGANDLLYLRLSNSGYFTLYLKTTAGGVIYDKAGSIPYVPVAGSPHTYTISVTRESASAAGSAAIYVDGQLHETLTLTAGTPYNIPFTFYYSSYYTASTEYDSRVYNRALSADEALSLYESGVAAADQYGSQTAVSSYTEWTGASGATPPTGWGISSNGIFTIFDSGDGAPYDVCLKIEHNGVNNNPCIYKAYSNLVVGKKYRISGWFKKGTGSTGRFQFGKAPTYNEWIASNLTDAVWAKYSYEFTATDTTYRLYIYGYSTGAGEYHLFDEIFLEKLGACLDLNESGIDAIASLNSATLINSPALPYTTFSGASATGFHAESDGSGPHVAGTTDAIPFVSGRRYRVQFTLTLHSGTAPYYGAAVSLAGAVIGGASASNLAVEGLNTYEFTCTGSDTGVIEFWNNSAPANYDISDFSVVYLGWKDSSTNGLDAAFPASGCAVVLFNNIVSTPGGSIYNWESKETGFNHEDAGGYAYKISEADACDGLFLIGHNLGTASALVSIESSDDETNWTERLAAFTPSDDRAIMKLLTSFRAASKRLKVDTASVAPYIAVAILGVRMEFPFPPDSPYDPYNIGIESESEVSVEGNHLGDVIYYYPIAQRVVFSNPLRSFITDTYKPFWDTHGRLRKLFAWAWDLTNYPDVVYFMKLTKNARLSMPLSVGTYADSLVVDMEGVAEP